MEAHGKLDFLNNFVYQQPLDEKKISYNCYHCHFDQYIMYTQYTQPKFTFVQNLLSVKTCNLIFEINGVDEK
jgi:hypothetical protein